LARFKDFRHDAESGGNRARAAAVDGRLTGRLTGAGARDSGLKSGHASLAFTLSGPFGTSDSVGNKTLE
jgi:hypothetical protein